MVIGQRVAGAVRQSIQARPRSYFPRKIEVTTRAAGTKVNNDSPRIAYAGQLRAELCLAMLCVSETMGYADRSEPLINAQAVSDAGRDASGKRAMRCRIQAAMQSMAGSASATQFSAKDESA